MTAARMVRTARPGTVSFVPLLSPPIRVSLQQLQRLDRSPFPSTLPAQSQGRALHLYKTAKAKTILGMHKIIPFQLYVPPPVEASDHRINLIDGKTKQVLGQNISLKTLYEEHLRPGRLLYPTEPVPSSLAANVERQIEEGTPQQFNTYATIEAMSIPGVQIKVAKPGVANSSKLTFYQLGELKRSNLLLKSPIKYFQMNMDKAYRFLLAACPVEFNVRFGQKYLGKKFKLQRGPDERWPWMHNHYPHLRPDFIMKCMPQGTYYLIKPFSDGNVVQWVLAMPIANQKPSDTKNLTKRVLKVQKSVKLNVSHGQQPGLPMSIRESLTDRLRKEVGFDSDELDKGKDEDDEDDDEDDEDDEDDDDDDDDELDGVREEPWDPRDRSPDFVNRYMPRSEGTTTKRRKNNWEIIDNQKITPREMRARRLKGHKSEK
ncbi:hypothetical protein P280DRAFT_469384 [Massarina eburnea CBS 473.64]|uniref:Uncharacterized protein n=1 Tax=Massarina eburnea CBS 473.64 TaxID=1395130 RepID=A0A6A6S0T1_9PLEO|nr:hypothetical protein P280DRAFT_469384 [Massarina eburnea CBS 473.64]